ncbi:MAG: hypothetical protein ACYSUX_07730 [Planctomycetota bacterium]|jgi:hypothetical protein
MVVLVILSDFGRQKTKPISLSPQHCWGLKKQSQFAGQEWAMGVCCRNVIISLKAGR